MTSVRLIGTFIAALATLASGAEPQAANELTSGRTYAEQRYSPLTQINASNVRGLCLAWYLDLPRQGSLQATPLEVDGTLYFPASNGHTFAVDARTGRERWHYDPDLANHPLNTHTVLFGANRGVAYWKAKIYVGTVDGRLVALDSRTGRVLWEQQTLEHSSQGRILSGAPVAFKGKVIVGQAGYSTARAYVTAYDAETGQQQWRFYTVPGDPTKGFENSAMAMAAQTWSGEWWKQGGGGSVWDSIVYDPDFNRVYIGTGNPYPHDARTRDPRGGDNLFTSSIVALDADTGAYVWHYQATPHDTWNYDSTMPMVLADLKIDGNPRKVLMQAPKNGFFYVIDRATGKLISAEKFGKVTWAEKVDLKTGRPIENPQSRYPNGPVAVWPSALGLGSWQRMSFNPKTGLVYIPAIKMGMRYGAKTGGFDPSDPDDGTGSLLAWDPVAQKKRWEVRYTQTLWNGGTLATAGNLVFQGTGRGQFIAYDARDGRELWSFNAGLGIIAAPMSYAIDGVQYISLLVGYGGTANIGKVTDYGWRYNEQTRRLLTFALGKHAALPPGSPPRFEVRAVDDPDFSIDAHQAAQGEKLSFRCSSCHGIHLENFAGIAPDLRESVLAKNWEAFDAIVRGGMLAAMGMPRFEDLSEEEARALFMYVRKRAREAPPLKPETPALPHAPRSTADASDRR